MVISLSMVAEVIGVHSFIVDVSMCTLGAACVSCGGFVALLDLTHLVEVVFCVGILLRSWSIFSNSSICSMPFMLLLPFNACVGYPRALITVSAGVTVNWITYLCFKNTVSKTL